MPQPWDTAELLRAVEAALKPRIAEAGGVIDTASDPDRALEILAESPARFRVVLGWSGYGDHPDAVHGMSTHRIYTIVQASAGLLAKPGNLMHQGRPSLTAGPMGTLIERVSRWVRALHFPNGSGYDSRGFAMTGSAWLVLDEIETIQHQLDFSVVAALPYEDNRITLALP